MVVAGCVAIDFASPRLFEITGIVSAFRNAKAAASAVPSAQNAFEGCDAMLAVGTRFAEICTGSYGAVPPKNLVHVDINPGAIGRNHEAAVAIHADARDAVPVLAVLSLDVPSSVSILFFPFAGDVFGCLEATADTTACISVLLYFFESVDPGVTPLYSEIFTSTLPIKPRGGRGCPS